MIPSMGDPECIPEIVSSILLSLSPYPLRRGLSFREGGFHGSLITAAGFCMGDVHRVFGLLVHIAGPQSPISTG
jgi:hypothetical protein